MLKLLIDTCVWLDLAKDHRQQVTLRYIEELMEAGEIALVVPRQVANEFSRNRDRIIKENQQSLSSVFKRVKDTIRRFGDEEHRNSVLEQLDDVDHRLSTLSEAVIDSIEHIERLFEKVTPIETTEAVKLRATDRAMTKRAPFHRNKNSMGDALLIELFMEAIASRAEGERLIFVTHNTQDFSAPSRIPSFLTPT
jgi:predicted nucleic acid-binding protein